MLSDSATRCPWRERTQRFRRPGDVDEGLGSPLCGSPFEQFYLRGSSTMSTRTVGGTRGPDWRWRRGTGLSFSRRQDLAAARLKKSTQWCATARDGGLRHGDVSVRVHAVHSRDATRNYYRPPSSRAECRQSWTLSHRLDPNANVLADSIYTNRPIEPPTSDWTEEGDQEPRDTAVVYVLTVRL